MNRTTPSGPIGRTRSTTSVLRVYLTDHTCSRTYFSDGNHANVTGSNPYRVLLADAGGFCEIADTAVGPLQDPANFAVTVTVTPPPMPQTTDDCKNGGWQNYGTTFKNQGDCVSFVSTGGKNPPAGP